MKTTVSIQREVETVSTAVWVAERIPFRSKTDSCMISGWWKESVCANHMRIGQHGICDTARGTIEVLVVGVGAIAELGVRSRSVWS